MEEKSLLFFNSRYKERGTDGEWVSEMGLTRCPPALLLFAFNPRRPIKASQASSKCRDLFLSISSSFSCLFFVLFFYFIVEAVFFVCLFCVHWPQPNLIAREALNLHCTEDQIDIISSKLFYTKKNGTQFYN